MTFTVPVPGGTVTVRRLEDLSAKHVREVQAQVMTIGTARVVAALRGPSNDTADLSPELEWTPADDAALEALSDATMWALLDSWTFGPVPDSPAAVAALHPVLRVVLADVTAGEGSRLLRRMLAL